MLTRSKLIPAVLLMAVVAFAAIACAQPEPAPAIDEARLQSIVESAVAKSAPAPAPAPAPQVSAEEISAMVEKSMMGMAESQVSAADIQAMVEDAVEGAAMEGASPEEIQKMVEGAVMAASEDALTADDVESAISMAVMEARRVPLPPRTCSRGFLSSYGGVSRAVDR